MTYLIEKLNENNRPTLGTYGRHIFRQYNTVQALERYQISKLIKTYGKLWLSIYAGDNIYGKPTFVWQYEQSNNLKGFTKCVIWMQS